MKIEIRPRLARKLFRLFLISTIIFGILAITTGCATVKPGYNDFSQCQKVRFEKYCKDTEGGILHVAKEVVRFGIEMYSKQEIKNLCSKHYANWGYSYLMPVEHRIEYYCDGEN